MFDISMLMSFGIGIALNSLMQFLWSFPLLILGMFRVFLFFVDGGDLLKFEQKIKIASMWGKDGPQCIVMGRWFIGYITQQNISYYGESYTRRHMYILCTSSYYNNHVMITDTKLNESLATLNSAFKFYIRDNETYYNLGYNTGIIHNIMKRTPSEKQKQVVDDVLDIFEEKRKCVAFLYGPPCTKKTATARFVAQRLLLNQYNVHMVDTFNPTDPGDTLEKLYTRTCQSDKDILLIVFDEIDIMINRIHEQKVAKPEIHVPISVETKEGWNRMLDSLNPFMPAYVNVIIIMTTNKTPRDIEALDAAYLEESRIDLKVHFNR